MATTLIRRGAAARDNVRSALAELKVDTSSSSSDSPPPRSRTAAVTDSARRPLPPRVRPKAISGSFSSSPPADTAPHKTSAASPPTAKRLALPAPSHVPSVSRQSSKSQDPAPFQSVESTRKLSSTPSEDSVHQALKYFQSKAQLRRAAQVKKAPARRPVPAASDPPSAHPISTGKSEAVKSPTPTIKALAATPHPAFDIISLPPPVSDERSAPLVADLADTEIQQQQSAASSKSVPRVTKRQQSSSKLPSTTATPRTARGRLGAATSKSSSPRGAVNGGGSVEPLAASATATPRTARALPRVATLVSYTRYHPPVRIPVNVPSSAIVVASLPATEQQPIDPTASDSATVTSPAPRVPVSVSSRTTVSASTVMYDVEGSLPPSSQAARSAARTPPQSHTVFYLEDGTMLRTPVDDSAQPLCSETVSVRSFCDTSTVDWSVNQSMAVNSRTRSRPQPRGLSPGARTQSTASHDGDISEYNFVECSLTPSNERRTTADASTSIRGSSVPQQQPSHPVPPLRTVDTQARFGPQFEGNKGKGSSASTKVLRQRDLPESRISGSPSGSLNATPRGPFGYGASPRMSRMAAHRENLRPTPAYVHATELESAEQERRSEIYARERETVRIIRNHASNDRCRLVGMALERCCVAEASARKAIARTAMAEYEWSLSSSLVWSNGVLVLAKNKRETSFSDVMMQRAACWAEIACRTHTKLDHAFSVAHADLLAASAEATAVKTLQDVTRHEALIRQIHVSFGAEEDRQRCRLVEGERVGRTQWYSRCFAIHYQWMHQQQRCASVELAARLTPESETLSRQWEEAFLLLSHHLETQFIELLWSDRLAVVLAETAERHRVYVVSLREGNRIVKMQTERLVAHETTRRWGLSASYYASTHLLRQRYVTEKEVTSRFSIFASCIAVGHWKGLAALELREMAHRQLIEGLHDASYEHHIEQSVPRQAATAFSSLWQTEQWQRQAICEAAVAWRQGFLNQHELLTVIGSESAHRREIMEHSAQMRQEYFGNGVIQYLFAPWCEEALLTASRQWLLPGRGIPLLEAAHRCSTEHAYMVFMTNMWITLERCRREAVAREYHIAVQHVSCELSRWHQLCFCGAVALSLMRLTWAAEEKAWQQLIRDGTMTDHLLGGALTQRHVDVVPSSLWVGRGHDTAPTDKQSLVQTTTVTSQEFSPENQNFTASSSLSTHPSQPATARLSNDVLRLHEAAAKLQVKERRERERIEERAAMEHYQSYSTWAASAMRIMLMQGSTTPPAVPPSHSASPAPAVVDLDFAFVIQDSVQH